MNVRISPACIMTGERKGNTFFGEVLFHDYSPVLGNPYFVKLFEIGRIDRQELDTLIDRERFILRFQQNAIVEGQPANITFKVFM